MVQGSKNFLQSWLARQIHYPKEKIPQRPMNVILCLESACNLHCIQCDIWRTRVVSLKMTITQRKEIIHKLKKWLGQFTLNIFAGEPLLHPQIFELIRFASTQGIKSIITTNGTTLNEAVVKKIIDTGLYGMFVSLDGVTKETHDSIRGVSGTHERAFQGIRRVIALRKKRPRVIIETLIMNKNVHELVPMADFVKTLGVDGLIFQPVTSKYGFGSDEYNPLWHKGEESLLPSPDRVLPVLRDLIKKKREGYPILNSYKHLENAATYFCNPGSFAVHAACYAHQNFVITDTGDIQLCFSQKKVGNFEDMDYQSVWRGKLADEARLDNKWCDKTSKILLCYSTDIDQLFERIHLP